MGSDQVMSKYGPNCCGRTHANEKEKTEKRDDTNSENDQVPVVINQCATVGNWDDDDMWLTWTPFVAIAAVMTSHTNDHFPRKLPENEAS
ncbi:hypothetical protein Q1695_016306 [Nippostrongylus brasiliensis]|nr:hypothetical protein Q1695_016306 [Nippostrongylus brasiliensis]